MIDAFGGIHEGQFKNGLPNGFNISYYNGVYIDIGWKKNGKKHGNVITLKNWSFFTDGWYHYGKKLGNRRDDKELKNFEMYEVFPCFEKELRMFIGD